MNLSDELIKSLFSIIAGSLAVMIPASIAALVLMWADVRSLKKAMNSAFNKIRDLEKKSKDQP